MIQHTAHHFSFEQIQLLNRGPTYVVPAQMRLFNTQQVLDSILIEQFVPLRKQLLSIFTRFSLDLARQQTFRRSLEQQFLQSFSSPVPKHIQQRAKYEQKLLQSIQSKLTYDDLILRRTADDFNTFYLDNYNNFNRLCQNQMESSTYFELVTSLDVDNPNAEQQYLTELIVSMDTFLQGLQQKKELHMEYFIKLQLAKKTNLQLPYLYFLPVTHQVVYSHLSSSSIHPSHFYFRMVM